jgi:hypothetical protein
MSPDLIARSKNALIKSVSDTLPRVAKPLWALGREWGAGLLHSRVFRCLHLRFDE